MISQIMRRSWLTIAYHVCKVKDQVGIVVS